MDTLGLPVMITVTPTDIQDRDVAHDVFWRPGLTQPHITQVWAGPVSTTAELGRGLARNYTSLGT
ncbi:hypothetical protein [Streptomyces sp. NBC_00996]|uniref:hypothetical protein n=1 Tax=Streptomyces sp. NBC_00996 TaxID=2903710 RepID=UPI00386CF618|nr:hypothetical protein OG390_48935 [Streptomyces sp. NBC_00996]